MIIPPMMTVLKYVTENTRKGMRKRNERSEYYIMLYYLAEKCCTSDFQLGWEKGRWEGMHTFFALPSRFG